MNMPGLTGIGCTLLPHVASGALRVSAMDPEGPAARSGLIAVGDVLFEVDDNSVVGLSGEQARTLILGVPGTAISLGLRRLNGKMFYVRLLRGAVKKTPPPSQQTAPLVKQLQTSAVQPVQAQSRAVRPLSRPGVNGSRMEGSDDNKVEQVGIGIGLALDEERNLTLSNLIPGSPALRSGLLEVGDILRNVDGRDVRGMTPELVRPFILGPPGTFVTISVQRGNTQIVARMARAKTGSDAPSLIPAGSNATPTADATTFSAVYAQLTSRTKPIADPVSSTSTDQPHSPFTSDAKIPANNFPLSSDQASDQELCGVGIVLSQNMEAELAVLTMNEGGPAARSNLIKKDDILCTIDGHDVYKKDIDYIRPYILGLPGSTVVLGFQRPGMRGNRLVHVRLRRGNLNRDLRNIPNPSPRPSPSATPGGGATPAQSPKPSPHATPMPTRPSSPKMEPTAPPHEPRELKQAKEPESEENKYGPDGPVCGLGIVLVPTHLGMLCVASITEGGPAARSGRVHRGDFVETIDSKSVRGKTIDDVRPLILGRAGTSVTLGLRRESEDAVVYVRIMREPVRLGEVLVPGMRSKDTNDELQQAQAAASDFQQQVSAETRNKASVNLQPNQRPMPSQSNQPTSPPAVNGAAPTTQNETNQNSVAVPRKPRMCGIGVVLVQVAGGAVCVKSVNKGGPAYSCGMIVRGDILQRINGTSVMGFDVEKIKPLILGHEGTPITLNFLRVGSLVQGKRAFDVTVLRAVVDSPTQASANQPFERATRG